MLLLVVASDTVANVYGEVACAAMDGSLRRWITVHPHDLIVAREHAVGYYEIGVIVAFAKVALCGVIFV